MLIIQVQGDSTRSPAIQKPMDKSEEHHRAVTFSSIQNEKPGSGGM